jgi:hypothetical protein
MRNGVQGRSTDMRTRRSGQARRASPTIVVVVMALSGPLLSPTTGLTSSRCDIEGTSAAERLVGSLRGGVGEDLVDGGIGADKVRGGPGEDRLVGGAGRDIMRGQHGPDYLDGEDGTDARDLLHGGPGNDGCGVDGRDITIGCETVVS